jgi:hypothetical protein
VCSVVVRSSSSFVVVLGADGRHRPHGDPVFATCRAVAYRFVPRQGGFAITAITEEDLAVPVSPRTTLKWPKV